MKIRRILTILGVGAITLTTLATNVLAEEPFSTISEATAQFKPNEGTPTLINPDNPGDPSDGGNGAEAGPLSLDYVPNINFDEDTISATQKDYVAVRNEDDTTPFVQVTDNRGTGTGWNLTASLNEFELVDENNETNNKKLEGAYITLLNGRIVTNGSQIREPENGSKQLKGHEDMGIKLTSDKAVIMNAEKDEGMGSWAMVWKDSVEDTLDMENILLTVPGGIAKAGEYTAEIKWTLQNAPTPTEEQTTPVE